MDNIRNEYIRLRDSAGGTVWRENTEARLRLFGHVGPTDEIVWAYWETVMIELPLKWKRRRPRIWFMDAMREDMAVVEVTGI